MTNTLLIVDLEATCVEKETPEFDILDNEHEIIEIGAVVYDCASRNVIDTYQSFVKPIIHPVLSEFCTRLTGIQQPDVESANSFTEVIIEFDKWAGSHNDAIFCSWGNYDRNAIQQSCDKREISIEFNSRHINLKQVFARLNGVKRMGVSTALDYVGMAFDGSAHRALDDAKNISRLVTCMLSKHSKDKILSFVK